MSFLQKWYRCLKKLKRCNIYIAPLYYNKLCIEMVTQACDLSRGIKMLEGICVPKKKTIHIFFLLKKTKHICFHDTNNVTNITSYNINSYLFERHKKYGILITEFVRV